jgi:hypothetical protein
VQFVISGSTETRHDDAAGQDQRHQAVKWVRHASKALTTATIRNCWWKAGILGGQSTSATVPRSDVATHVQVCSCQRCRGP